MTHWKLMWNAGWWMAYHHRRLAVWTCPVQWVNSKNIGLVILTVAAPGVGMGEFAPPPQSEGKKWPKISHFWQIFACILPSLCPQQQNSGAATEYLNLLWKWQWHHHTSLRCTLRFLFINVHILMRIKNVQHKLHSCLKFGVSNVSVQNTDFKSKALSKEIWRPELDRCDIKSWGGKC